MMMKASKRREKASELIIEARGEDQSVRQAQSRNPNPAIGDCPARVILNAAILFSLAPPACGMLESSSLAVWLSRSRVRS